MRITVLRETLRTQTEAPYVCRNCLLQKAEAVRQRCFYRSRPLPIGGGVRTVTMLRSKNLQNRISQKLISLTKQQDTASTQFDNTSNSDLDDTIVEFELPEKVAQKLGDLRIGTSESEKIQALIKQQLLSPLGIWKYYKSIQHLGLISEDAAVMLAILLYRFKHYDKSCAVMLDNVPFGSGFISAFVTKLIPGLDQIDRQEIALGNMLQELCRVGHGSLARQLIQEMGQSMEIFDDVCMVLDARYQGVNGPDLANYIFKMKRSRYPHMENFPVWTQVVVVSSRFEEIFGSHNGSSISPRVLNLLKNYPLSLTAIMRMKKSNTEIDNALINLLTNKSVVLSSQDLQSLAQRFGHSTSVKRHDDSDDNSYSTTNDTKTPFVKAWKAYKQYGKRHGYDQAVLDVFLKNSIKMKQTITSSDIVKIGQGNFSINKLTAVVSNIAWGIKKENATTNTNDNDGAFYKVATNDVDTSLIKRVATVIPQHMITPVFNTMLNRMDKTYQSRIPGRVLWKLLLGMDQSGIKLSSNLQYRLSCILVTRPHLELMRYMSLQMVPPKGIMSTLQQFVRFRRDQRLLSQTHAAKEADAKLFLAGLTVINDKISEQGKQPLTGAESGSTTLSPESAGETPSLSASLSNAMTDLFNSWDDAAAIDIMTRLNTDGAHLSDFISVQTVAKSVRLQRYGLALMLLKIIQVPEQAYFDFLIKSSKYDPITCSQLLSWLTNKREMEIPTPVLRKVIIGCCSAAQLTESQRLRMCQRVIRLLYSRGERMGPEAVYQLVEHTINNVEYNNWGSRRRLQFVLHLAKKDGRIPEHYWARWMNRIERMRFQRRGFWSDRYEHPRL